FTTPGATRAATTTRPSCARPSKPRYVIVICRRAERATGQPGRQEVVTAGGAGWIAAWNGGRSVVVAGSLEEVQGSLPRLRRVEDAEVRRPEDRVVRALPDQVDLLRPLELRAVREVVRIAVAVLGRHGREERPVLRREIDEARVRVPDHERLRRLRLVAAVQRGQERRVRGAVLAADRAVGREAAERSELEVVERRGRAVDDPVGRAVHRGEPADEVRRLVDTHPLAR